MSIIGFNAFGGTGLEDVILNEKLQEIDTYAFKSCTNLKSIYIGKQLSKMGDGVFQNCKNLREIEINEGNENFKFSKGILLNGNGTQMIYILPSTIPESQTEFSIPNGVTTTPGSMLPSDFPQVTKLIIPESVTKIDLAGLTNITELEVDIQNQKYLSENNNLYSKDGTTLYYYLENEETVNLKENVEIINGGSFGSKSLTNVKTINFTNSVKTLKGEIFGVGIQASLLTINIGKNVSDIVASSMRLNKDVNIVIDEDNNYYLYENKVLYNKDKSKIVSYFDKDKTEFVIPNSVHTIGAGAFFSSKLTKVEMSDSVTKIESSAFRSCPLTEIKWSNNLTEIGGYALWATRLVNIELPNGLTSIGDNCFLDSSKLEKIKIPNSVTTIGKDCFANCPRLTVEIDKKKGEIDGSPWGHVNGERGIKWLK